MLRHKRNKHEPFQDNTNSASESELTDSEATDSETDRGMTDADESSPSDRYTGEEYDPWESVIDKAFNKCQDQYELEVTKLIRLKNISQHEARKQVYQNMRSVFRKAVSGVFMDRIMWFNAVRKDYVYKSIKKTANNFMVLDDYSSMEAWKSAVSQRKYLFDTILSDFQAPELDGDTQEEESSDDEPMAKRAKV